MSKPDILGDLLSTDPNTPATTGTILLLRAEMKSEFKTVRSEMNQRFESVDQRLGRVEDKVNKIEDKVTRVEDKLTRVEEKVIKLENSLDLVARHVAILIERGK